MAAKKRKKRKARRKAVKRRTYRRNPAPKRRRRRTVARRRTYKRRSYRRNPTKILKAFSQDNIINIASLGVGFIGGIKAQKFVNNVEALANFRRFTGAIPFVLGFFLAARAKKKSVQNVGAGLSLSGLYDLVSQNIPQIGLSPVEGVDLDDYDEDYGTAIDVDGTAIDLEGEDDDDILVGEDDDPIEVVGGIGPYEMV